MATQTPNLKMEIADISDQFKVLVDALKRDFTILDQIYHVGRIIETTSATFDPNVALPGTSWVKLTDRVLVGAGGKYSVGNPGGSETHYHQTSIGFDGKTFYGHMGRADEGENGIPIYGSETFQSVDTINVNGWVNRSNVCREARTETVSNMPPYEPVYIWKRVG